MARLYDPLKLGATELKNRILMAPLTRNRALPDGTPGTLAGEYYRQRASAGLIITEATQVSAMGKGYLNTPGIYTDTHVQAWKQITDAVHAEGGKIFVQLWHVGRISHSSLLPNNTQPVAPSAIRAEAQTFTTEGMVDVSQPRALSIEEIKATIEDYRHAAQKAKEAGFDGIEVHAANGYLIDQFLNDQTNQRDDEYGGSLENRMRFMLEVMDAVKTSFPADQVGVRLSPTGTFNDISDSNRAEHFTHIAATLNPLGLAYLHMVEKFPGIDSSDEDAATLDSVRNAWDGHYIANGDYNRNEGEKAVASGRADAVAYGRPFIANPDLPERLEANATLNEPQPDSFYGGDHRGYTDYPFMENTKAA